METVVIGIIYCIENKTSGKKYVGQTKQTLNRRWLGHVHSSEKARSAIHKAICSYGKDNFLIYEIDRGETQESLDRKEHLWIDTLNTMTPHGYNLKTGGLEGSVYTEESRKKMSEARKGKYAGENHPMYGKPGYTRGKKLSADMRRRMSEGCKKSKLHNKFKPGKDNPNYGKILTDEQKQVIADGARKWRDNNTPSWAKKVVNVDTGMVFDSIKEAGKHHGISTQHIGCVCSGRRKTTGGYRWEYAR